MKRILPAATLLILSCLLVSGNAQFPELKVIANPGVPVTEISRDDLRAIYLGTKTGIRNAANLRPVLVTTEPGLTALARNYLGKTEMGLQTYYRSLVFSGRWFMPPSFGSEAEASAYVARTPGAIACVVETAPTSGVKTLRIR